MELYKIVKYISLLILIYDNDVQWRAVRVASAGITLLTLLLMLTHACGYSDSCCLHSLHTTADIHYLEYMILGQLESISPLRDK